MILATAAEAAMPAAVTVTETATAKAISVAAVSALAAKVVIAHVGGSDGKRQQEGGHGRGEAQRSGEGESERHEEEGAETGERMEETGEGGVAEATVVAAASEKANAEIRQATEDMLTTSGTEAAVAVAAAAAVAAETQDSERPAGAGECGEDRCAPRVVRCSFQTGYAGGWVRLLLNSRRDKAPIMKRTHEGNAAQGRQSEDDQQPQPQHPPQNVSDPLLLTREAPLSSSGARSPSRASSVQGPRAALSAADAAIEQLSRLVSTAQTKDSNNPFAFAREVRLLSNYLALDSVALQANRLGMYTCDARLEMKRQDSLLCFFSPACPRTCLFSSCVFDE
eukprot:978070-Pleurochrysis_carterae.AAC.1